MGWPPERSAGRNVCDLLLATLLTGSGAGTAFAQDGPATSTEPLPGRIERRWSSVGGSGKRMVPWLVYLPAGYDAEKGPWPVAFGLHGTAGRPEQILQIPELTELADRHGVIVVCPSTSGWYGSTFWLRQPKPMTVLSDRHMDDVLQHTLYEFAVDEQRIYLFGVSLGGAGAWHLAYRRPKLWTAIATISPATYHRTKDLQPVAHLPALVVQGTLDRAIPTGHNRQLAERARRLGMPLRYFEIDGAGHDLSAYPIAREILEFFASVPDRRLLRSPTR